MAEQCPNGDSAIDDAFLQHVHFGGPLEITDPVVAAAAIMTVRRFP